MGTNCPQLLVQKFLVVSGHFRISSWQEMTYDKRAPRIPRSLRKKGCSKAGRSKNISGARTVIADLVTFRFPKAVIARIANEEEAVPNLKEKGPPGGL